MSEVNLTVRKKRIYKDRKPSAHSVNFSNRKELKLHLKSKHGVNTLADAKVDSTRALGLICSDKHCDFRVRYYRSKADAGTRWNMSEFKDHIPTCARDDIIVKKRKIQIEEEASFLVASSRQEAKTLALEKFGYLRQDPKFKAEDRFGFFCDGHCGLNNCLFKVYCVKRKRSIPNDKWYFTNDSVMSHIESASEITRSFKTEAILLSASGVGIKEVTMNEQEATPAETLKLALNDDHYESDSSVDSDSSVEFVSHTLASKVRKFYNLTNLNASYEIVLENTTRITNSASINCFDVFQIPESFKASIHSEKEFLMEARTKDDQVMKELFNVQLTRSLLRCLLTQSNELKAKWLNDEVINAYFNILQRNCNDDKVAFATTHFMAKLLLDGDKYEYDATLKRFFSEASKQSSLNIFELSQIFVPINILNAHWTLIFIDMLNQEIQYYDPMAGNDEDYNIFLQAILQWLVDEAKDTSTAFDTSKWRLMEMKNGPKQRNNNDCGMYLTMTAHCLTEKIPLSLLTPENITYLREYVWFKIMSYNHRSRGPKKNSF